MYMKFRFVDPTYGINHRLELVSVFFKNDSGRVTDITTISEAIQNTDSSQNNYLILKTKMLEEALYAKVQVSL